MQLKNFHTLQLSCLCYIFLWRSQKNDNNSESIFDQKRSLQWSRRAQLNDVCPILQCSVLTTLTGVTGLLLRVSLLLIVSSPASLGTISILPRPLLLTVIIIIPINSRQYSSSPHKIFLKSQRVSYEDSRMWNSMTKHIIALIFWVKKWIYFGNYKQQIDDNIQVLCRDVNILPRCTILSSELVSIPWTPWYWSSMRARTTRPSHSGTTRTTLRQN